MIKAHILALCAADLAKHLNDWQDYLRHEKQVSKHTLRAYCADLTHFLEFLVGHSESAPSLNDLSNVSISDFRAWLSRKAMEGTSNASRARSLSGIKNFLNWLDRRGIMHNAAVNVLRSPKIAHKLPRPLEENQAMRLLEEADLMVKEDWVGQRDRALFTLLYGCGLRIDEALSLNVKDMPRDGFLRVIGKGQKERQVPVLEIVEKTLEAYLSMCPYHQTSLRGGNADAAIQNETGLLRSQ